MPTIFHYRVVKSSFFGLQKGKWAGLSDGCCTVQLRSTEEGLCSSISGMFTRNLQKRVNLCHRGFHIISKNKTSSKSNKSPDFNWCFICGKSASDGNKKMFHPAEGFDDNGKKKKRGKNADQHSEYDEKFSRLTCQVMQTYWSMGRVHRQWPSWFVKYN